MPVEIFTTSDLTTLNNPGVTSLQLLWPGNSPDAKATITRVAVAPGASQPRHSHTDAEQIWIVEQGSAELLLADGKQRTIGAGHVVRMPAGDIHGRDEFRPRAIRLSRDHHAAGRFSWGIPQFALNATDLLKFGRTYYN